jgi:hypothetical protein
MDYLLISRTTAVQASRVADFSLQKKILSSGAMFYTTCFDPKAKEMNTGCGVHVKLSV